jgi:hypothetical protein
MELAEIHTIDLRGFGIMHSKCIEINLITKRCMMDSRDYVQSENVTLLKEIYKIKAILSELYAQNGPNSSDYITFSCQLNFLVHEYVEEKMNLFQDHLMDTRNLKNVQYKEMIEI